MSKDEKKSRKVPKKSNTANRPTKKMRPNHEDNIAKSKKLIDKSQNCRRNSKIKSSRLSTRSNLHGRRVCANGKPMPPLSELEKMFEDSDDENQPKIVTPIRNGQSINCATKLTDSNYNTPLTSPAIQNKSDVDCEEHTQLPKRLSTNNDPGYIDTDNEDLCPKKMSKRNTNISKPNFNSKSDDIASWLKDCEKVDYSDGSTDSNKTVDYDYSKCPIVSARPPSFSPLPSTSRDRETINRNDQLFNESLLKETTCQENQSKVDTLNETDKNNFKGNETSNGIQMLFENTINDVKIQDDVEILQAPCETIVIDDDIAVSKPVKRKSNDDCEILDCIEIVAPDNKKDSIKSTHNSEAIIIDDDDDFYKCINDNPSHDYKCINDNLTNDENTEVIDVDNIIAENKAIIQKYSQETSMDLDTVTYVDTSTVSNVNQNKNNSNKLADTVNHTIKSDAINVDDESPNTQNDTLNRLQDVVTEFFTKKHSEINSRIEIPNNAALPIWNKFTEWLNKLSSRNGAALNKSQRKGNQNQTLDDSVILIDDTPPPAPNIARKTPDVTIPTYCSTITQSIHPFFSNNKNTPAHARNYNNYPVTNHMPNTTFAYNSDSRFSNIEPGVQINSNRQRNNRRYISNTIAPVPQPVSTPEPQAAPKTPTKNYGDCPICMDSLANNSVASTICGHVFCMKCIEAALKASGRRCPTCRKVLKKGGYHQLFL